MTVHRIELVDRNKEDGISHRHRWGVRCSCGGWFGVPRRRKKEAVKQHDGHQRQLTREAKQVRSGAGPRALTPASELPEALR